MYTYAPVAQTHTSYVLKSTHILHLANSAALFYVGQGIGTTIFSCVLMCAHLLITHPCAVRIDWGARLGLHRLKGGQPDTETVSSHFEGIQMTLTLSGWF